MGRLGMLPPLLQLNFAVLDFLLPDFSHTAVISIVLPKGVQIGHNVCPSLQLAMLRIIVLGMNKRGRSNGEKRFQFPCFFLYLLLLLFRQGLGRV